MIVKARGAAALAIVFLAVARQSAILEGDAAAGGDAGDAGREGDALGVDRGVGAAAHAGGGAGLVDGLREGLAPVTVAVSVTLWP